MRILVVEDDQFVREYIGICLQDEGHEVVLTSDAQAALETILADPCPDFLLSDFNLGSDLDGVDVAEQFKGRCPNGPILIISGRPDVARNKIARQQCGTLLSKPFFRRDLLAAMDRATLAALP